MTLLKIKRTILGKVIACTYQTTKEIIAKVQEIKLINHKGENCGIRIKVKEIKESNKKNVKNVVLSKRSQLFLNNV